MSRRSALRLLGAAGVTAAVAGVAKATPAAATGQQFVTTSALNLRAKPRSTARVLRVMPEGALVTRIGGGEGRYVKVVYNGTRGYAHLDYLNDSDHHVPEPDFVAEAVTTTDVNLRSGPSSSHSVIRVLDPGASIRVSNQLENGYRYVMHNEAVGWIWDAYVGDPINGGDGGSGVSLETTSAVNHRTMPSLSAAIITVIPAGTTVFGLGERSNGFEKVRHNNKTGWVYATYLA